ncbi:o-succinylbenzoate--CoA ligase [Mycolicibacterium brumae]|uniref:O-succinylbenzoic acid--CoA ligase n=1 Tax=Mycolicibacterium brumae TaxID=85968 RepID=A0A2G5PGW5_9MYCO|nr:o-succinylbenzoate--CoA ligase [Mycolicibacterium brumae]PIB77541.1 O-succinylbenzoic acid--CoA ligase [Mycolicibacterium brumae]
MPDAELLGLLDDALSGRITLLPLAGDDDHSRGVAEALRAGEPIDDAVALVVPTSGSTGFPKGAMLSTAAVLASAAATHDRLGGPGRWLLALPPHHIAGLQVLIRGLVAGTAPVRLDVSGGFDVTALPGAIAALGSGRRYLSLVSNQLAAALRDPAAAAALAETDAVLLGGGPAPAPLLDSAAAARIPVVRTYGMSETAGGCVYDGVPLNGVRVRVDGGRVRLGGPTLACGYRNPVTPNPFAEPGWFATDDLGELDGDGRLRVLGRVDDGILTGGLTVLPQLVEAALLAHPAIAEAVVFGTPEPRLGQQVTAALVLSPDAAAPTLGELRRHLEAAGLAGTAAPRVAHVVEEIPRRGIGKPDRRALVARFSGA